MFKKLKVGLRAKIGLMVVAVGVICTVLIAVVGTMSSQEAIEKQVINQLTSSSRLMMSNVKGYFERTETFTNRLTTNRLIEGLFIAFEGAYYGGAFNTGVDNNILTPTYMANDKLYGQRIRTISNDYGMKNILLVSVNGQVIMRSSIDREGHFLGRDLKKGALSPSDLANCYNRALASTDSKVYFADFAYYDVSKTVNSFICKKMKAEFDHEDDGIYKGDSLGVVIAEVDVERINEIVSQRHGMGETGQFYLVGNDKLLRSSLYVESEKYNVTHSLKNKIEIKSKIIDLALEGKSGHHTHAGPNNYDVIAFYDSISVFGNKWVFVSEKSVDEMNKPIDAMITFMVIFTCIIVGLLILMSTYISKLLSYPVMTASGSLRYIYSDVVTNSNEMKTYAGDLNTYSSDLSSAVQETMSTLDELTQMVNKNVDNVDRSSDISKDSKTAAEEGLETIKKLIQAFEGINQSNESVVDAMSMTSEKMMEISSVIKSIAEKTSVINDIVFQIKLLSFNASVEAARAGEHGKGFSVVAEEVGNLATASGKAALEISEMVTQSVSQVEAIVNDTNERISVATETGREKVELGNVIAGDCGKKLDEILVNVNNVNDSINEVRVASNEQTLGISEVSKAMQSLDSMSSNTNTLSSELLNASSLMENKSIDLGGVVKTLDDLIEGGDEEVTRVNKILSTDEVLRKERFDDDEGGFAA